MGLILLVLLWMTLCYAHLSFFWSTSLPPASTRSTIKQLFHAVSTHTKQCTAVDKSLQHQEIFLKNLGKAENRTGAAGCDARTLSIVLKPPPPLELDDCIHRTLWTKLLSEKLAASLLPSFFYSRTKKSKLCVYKCSPLFFFRVLLPSKSDSSGSSSGHHSLLPGKSKPQKTLNLSTPLGLITTHLSNILTKKSWSIFIQPKIEILKLCGVIETLCSFSFNKSFE